MTEYTMPEAVVTEKAVYFDGYEIPSRSRQRARRCPPRPTRRQVKAPRPVCAGAGHRTPEKRF